MYSVQSGRSWPLEYGFSIHLMWWAVFSAELSCIVIGVTGVAEVSGLGWISLVVVVGVGVELKYSFLSRLSASGVVR